MSASLRPLPLYKLALLVFSSTPPIPSHEKSILLSMAASMPVTAQLSTAKATFRDSADSQRAPLPTAVMGMAVRAQISTGKLPLRDRKRGVKDLVDKDLNLRTLPPEYVLRLPESPLTASFGSIPNIDLSGLDGSSGQRKMTVDAIANACADWGFFRISNHGINGSVMEEMLRSVDAFFNLTWEEKMRYGSDDVMDPVRYGTSLNTSAQHDLHWRDYLRHFGHPHTTFPLWPDNPPNYKYAARQFLDDVRHLALRLMGAISEGVGLESNYIEKSLGQGSQIVASNYYPPCPEPHRTLGLAAHSDHGGLTILMENDVAGLQVKHNDEWVAVQHVPETFVVNLGDYLEILSNGRYKSVEHRAVVNQHRARISVAVGHGPEMTAKVAPASPLVDEKAAAQYRPITYRDYMKIQQSSAIRGKTPLQAIMVTNVPKELSPLPNSL